MRAAFLLIMTTTTLSAEVLTYPQTRKEDVVDMHHGVQIADPYRWLEDDNSEETKAWVKAQNQVTFAYLEKLPRREEIKTRLQKLWNYERMGQPFEHGGRWFFTHNSGLQNQAVLMTTTSLEAEPKVLLDPNAMSKDGTTSLSDYAPSEDGKLIAYGISEAGSDWTTLRVRDIATGHDLDDVVKWVKFSGVSWRKDGSGFYYSRYDEPKPGAALTAKNEFHKLYFHPLGKPQSDDQLIYERKDEPKWGFGGGVTEDGDYLVIQVWLGTEPKNRVFYQKIAGGGPVVELLKDNDARYDFIDNDGPVFYFRTDLNAPCFQVIAIDVRKPERGSWRIVVPEVPKVLLEGVSTVGGQMFCEYLRDAKTEVKCFDLDGRLIRDITLPGIGSAGGFGGHRYDTSTFYTFTSFTEPGAIYRMDLKTGESKLWRKPQVDFEGSAFETQQVFFHSKDGTKVPMFIVHKKGLKLDGSNPTLLYGYGGFNINLTPGFSVSRAVWLEMGGVFAMSNLRGGGEYGRQWHQAGIKLGKQNVFDDFIAAAEWLIAHKYTTSARLAIQGGSNGGLLVGACLTQRPELYAAALPAVGVLDMLRFEKFTIGWGWKSDYGSVENPAEFNALLRYSPYHNLKPGTRYPATLVLTSDHDDRVVPAHSFKFAARLQECQAKDGPPVLIRIETSAGHGAGTALNKTIEKTAGEWAFLVRALGMQ
ncbi:MAG: prolyl oligopeptidase family serine peptidase [Prosthecobacter sp.]|uniref:prolyl oligopeptidase family serine peptidase n=1 Tax=Prosthecobacter sp. TaxID=1965333 RepID=UPI0025D001E4|nr:prolyl oligopeptidase family serine peptidase [Prosthecobacter sp.]MCF7786441.1 prolyl oligopeptidase family serine peptidase [Prosthecobacter sp.]